MTNDQRQHFDNDSACILPLNAGLIRGSVDPNHPGIRVFKGVPFADPPVGLLRWKPPVPIANWTGIRDCTAFGPACPQPKNVLGFDPQPQDEDCLYLNVWTPLANDNALPVMVWFHGGGHSTGAGSQQFYHGANLAKQGVIVVTVNYRLGPLGYFAHPLLSQESSNGVSGNYGFLDQIAALHWVQQNIRAFGGDPNNVTIFGESAGAVSVALHLTSDFSKGLFHRAIIQSGSVFSRYRTLRADDQMESAEERGIRQARMLTEVSDALRILRQTPASQLLESIVPSQGLYGKGEKFGPIVDHHYLRDQPRKIWQSRSMHSVPLLIGTNRDEGTIFVRQLQTKTIEDFQTTVRNRFADHAEDILEAFPLQNDQDAREALNRLITLMLFSGPAREHAMQMADCNSNVYLYRFTRRPNVAIGPLSSLGAYHGLEINYVFGNLTPRLASNPVDRELNHRMMQYWTNFARTGNPNGDGLVPWPSFDQTNNLALELSDVIGTCAACEQSDQQLFERFNLRQ